MPLALCAWDGLAGYDLRDDKRKGFTPFDLEGRLVGLVCHAACYTLLAQQLRYRLKLKDVQHLAKNKWQALLMQGDYGGILDHQEQVIFCALLPNLQPCSIAGTLLMMGCACQDFDYERLHSEGKFWMVEDPAVCERNAQRILDAWRPFTKLVVDEVKERERQRRRGPCTAVFCSFRRASALAAERGGSSEGSDGVSRLWKAMAAFPAELVVIIVGLADLAYTRDMAEEVI